MTWFRALVAVALLGVVAACASPAEEGVSPEQATPEKVGPVQTPLEEDPPAGEEPEPVVLDTESDESLIAVLDGLPESAEQLCELEDPKELHELVERIFAGFEERDERLRSHVVSACRSSLDALSVGFRHEFGDVLVEPLLGVLASEQSESVRLNCAELLRQIGMGSILFGEHSLAHRILRRMAAECERLDASRDLFGLALRQVVDRRLDAHVESLLSEDLMSYDPDRQRGAARLVARLGRNALPLLMGMLTSPLQQRTRLIAAELLAESGSEAVRLLKRTLALEGGNEQRVRILDVIDTITRDVHTELALALEDGSDVVHRSALRLAERLDDDRTVSLLAEHGRGDDPLRATSAIRALGRLSAEGTVEPLLAILQTTREGGRVIACCQALAQIGDPATADALAAVLDARSMLTRRRRWKSDVRASAADALARLPGRRAAELLAPFDLDPDPAVRGVAERVEPS